MLFLIIVISLLFAKGGLSQFFDQSFDCGWPGITRQQCHRRTGCEFSPIANGGYGRACFFPSSQVYRRIRCGPENVKPEVCTRELACIYRNDTTGSPHCFHRHPPGGLKFTDENIDCGWTDISSDQCRTGNGCIWKSQSSGNSCYFPRRLVTNRDPCGGQDITHQECTDKRCLFDSIAEENQAKCFYLPGTPHAIEIPTGFEAVQTATHYVMETRVVAE